MTNMHLVNKNNNLEDAVKAYKKDWGELWDEKETYKRQYFHDEDLIIWLSKENEKLKKELQKYKKEPKKAKKNSNS